MTPAPLLNSGRPWDPQTWDRYAYARNNPLRYIDPSGLYDYSAACKIGTAGDVCRADQKRFDDAVAKAVRLLATLPKDSQQYKSGIRLLNIPTTLTYCVRFIPSPKHKLNFDFGIAQVAGSIATGVNLQARHQAGFQMSYGF